MPTITLTSSAGGSNLPVTFGQVFKEGEFPSGSTLRLGGQSMQVNVMNSWPDGSIRFAICSALVTLSAGVQTTFDITAGAGPSGSTITEANLVSAMVGKSKTVQLGALGTVELATLVGTAALLRTFVSGPVMSEFHYSAAVDTITRVFFYVRVYSNGAVYARTTIHNGYLYVTPSTSRAYALTVSINGVAIYSNAVTQRHHSRITFKGWLSADSTVQLQHNTTYLMATQMVPTYGWTSPSDSAFSSLVQTYTPMGRANLPLSMGAAGYSPHIGLLPYWDALYLTSGGDGRAFNAVISNAESGGTYSIHYLDETTLKPYRFSVRPNLWMSGGVDGVAGSSGGTAATHDQAHQPSVGYLAYLLTAEYHFLEEVQFWATFNGANQNYVFRQGAKCLLIQEAARGLAWGLRTLATAAAITPDGDPLQAEFSNSLQSNVQYRWNQGIGGAEMTNQGRINNLGVLYLYSGSGEGDAYSPGDFTWVDAPWMQNFLCSAIGFAYALKVPQQTAPNRATHLELAHFAAKHVIGMLGDASGRPYPRAGEYGVAYGTTATANELQSVLNFYSSWAEQWAAQKVRDGLPEPDSSPGAPLLGASGSDPLAMSTGYWGNMHPALAYAVQLGAPGAVEARARLTAASNYAAGAATFNNTPQFGIVAATSAVVAVSTTYNGNSGATIRMGIRTTPEWVPAPGQFANISLNTLFAARPSGWPNSDVAAPFANWSSGVWNPDFGTDGGYVIHGSGHLVPGAALFGGVCIFDLGTRTWVMRNYPSTPLIDGGGSGTNWNGYLESMDAATLGHTYPPHTYGGLVIRRKALAGNSVGQLVRFMYGGSGAIGARCVHSFDLSSTNAPAVRRIDDVLGGGNNYPMCAHDTTRDGVWVLTTNGNGPLRFCSLVDFSVTTPAGISYNEYGDNFMVHIPTYDCLVAYGRSGSGGLNMTVRVSRIVAGIPQSFAVVTQNGTPPTDRKCGGRWSNALQAIVCYEAAGSNRVHLLRPDSPGNLTGSWTWTSQTLTGVGGATPVRNTVADNGSWGRFVVVEKYGIEFCLWADALSGSVQAWRLVGQ